MAPDVNDLLVELEVWLTQEGTYPALIPILVASIRAWLLHPYGDEPTFVWPSPLVQDAITTQQQLGWYAFLIGLHCKTYRFPTEFLLFNDPITEKRFLLGQYSLLLKVGTWFIIFGHIAIPYYMNPKHSPPYLDWIHFVAILRLNTLFDVAPSTKSTIDISPPPWRPSKTTGPT